MMIMRDLREFSDPSILRTHTHSGNRLNVSKPKIGDRSFSPMVRELQNTYYNFQ